MNLADRILLSINDHLEINGIALMNLEEDYLKEVKCLKSAQRWLDRNKEYYKKINPSTLWNLNSDEFNSWIKNLEKDFEKAE